MPISAFSFQAGDLAGTYTGERAFKYFISHSYTGVHGPDFQLELE